ncbi:hypothetical protein [Mycoplasma zalophi]|uniref:hypothetical protein n=1 Tax=Mycoplasma zalophi TaxID=191287 RepID=UPI001C0F65AA|nr:hypothetical protein [Mycoplasma zalophi]MBU4691114.1 hypothetical protein [Mycoplasma zalophi]
MKKSKKIILFTSLLMVSGISILGSVACAKQEIKDENTNTNKQTADKEPKKDTNTTTDTNTKPNKESNKTENKIIKSLDLEEESKSIGFKLPENVTKDNFNDIKLSDIKIINKNDNLEVKLINRNFKSIENQSSVFAKTLVLDYEIIQKDKIENKITKQINLKKPLTKIQQDFLIKAIRLSVLTYIPKTYNDPNATELVNNDFDREFYVSPYGLINYLKNNEVILKDFYSLFHLQSRKLENSFASEELKKNKYLDFNEEFKKYFEYRLNENSTFDLDIMRYFEDEVDKHNFSNEDYKFFKETKGRNIINDFFKLDVKGAVAIETDELISPKDDDTKSTAKLYFDVYDKLTNQKLYEDVFWDSEDGVHVTLSHKSKPINKIQSILNPDGQLNQDSSRLRETETLKQIKDVLLDAI